MTGFAVVIPSRFASTRLPGKPLLELLGKSMLQHVWERAMESDAEEVVVATDDARIADAAEAFGGVVCMTAADHNSGTDRIAEVAEIMDWPDSHVVVNLQGDEPTLPAALINQCAELVVESNADIATLASPFASDTDFDNPNCVKVIRNAAGNALYFSRAAIPYARDGGGDRAMQAALHHHGIYAYRCDALRRFVAAEAATIEQVEQLEQLRALSLGMQIAVGIPAVRPGTGVDTADDLLRVATELENDKRTAG